MSTKAETSAVDERQRLRQDLLDAFGREGIAYPASRLEETLEEYVQLKRLVAVVQSASAAAPLKPAPCGRA